MIDTTMFRKQNNLTLYESLPSPNPAIEPFQLGIEHPVKPRPPRVEGPELAIEIPNEVFDDRKFQTELMYSLVHMHGRTPWFGEAPPTNTVADFLYGVGRPVEFKRITKHVCPRSHLWFYIKFAIQSSLDRSPLGRGAYKAFMLFFMCNLANYTANANLSTCSIPLHSMSAKILRRFRKLHSCVPQWLPDMVSHTCTSLSRIVDKRWQEVIQSSCESSVDWDPSKLDLDKDVQHSFSHIHEQILASPLNPGGNASHTPFIPTGRPRGVLDDFLSNPDKFFPRLDSPSVKHLDSPSVEHLDSPVEHLDPPSMEHLDSPSVEHLGNHNHIHIMLYDIERTIGEDIDDWVACVAEVDEACRELEHLVHRYQSFVRPAYSMDDSDHLSIASLTIIELWVALDKLVIKDIPILADYSPEVSTDFLSNWLFRDTTSMHRLCRASQYILARHAQAHPRWSAFSNEFTEHSFPCRYYDSSPHLQCLKTAIEDALPIELSHSAKAIAFERQCPVSFDIWRSLTCWISPVGVGKDPSGTNFHDIPRVKLHITPHWEPTWESSFSPSSSTAPQPERCELGYVYTGPRPGQFQDLYKLLRQPYHDSTLQRYLHDTLHTSNNILADNTRSDHNLSSQEFFAFAHLRSGGSLQWFNILRELRSRTLDFRCQEVYLLFSQASAEVGPLDGTGEFMWHQETQNTSFCHALLDELEDLSADVGAGSLDGPAMATISLLAGVLTSRNFTDITERAIRLLRNVRCKTFSLIHELLYDARKSATNKESLNLLRDLAAVCRSTFCVPVGGAASHKLLHCTQDIEVAVSCAMFIRAVAFSTSSGMHNH